MNGFYKVDKDTIDHWGKYAERSPFIEVSKYTTELKKAGKTYEVRWYDNLDFEVVSPGVTKTFEYPR